LSGWATTTGRLLSDIKSLSQGHTGALPIKSRTHDFVAFRLPAQRSTYLVTPQCMFLPV